MAAKLVQTIRTKYTLNELIFGLVQGWYKKFDEIPKKESIGVLYAQNALETGGTVSMWNNNIGNVKFVANGGSIDDDKKYIMLANVWEIVNNKRVTFQPPHPATWFLAFSTLGDGVAHHLDFLRNNRYKKSWSAVEAGKPADFAHLLKVAGYYTASEADYIKLMNIYFNKFMKDTTYEKAVAELVPVEPILPVDPNVNIPVPSDNKPLPSAPIFTNPLEFIIKWFKK